jgi:hypothetical protein
LKMALAQKFYLRVSCSLFLKRDDLSFTARCSL